MVSAASLLGAAALALGSPIARDAPDGVLTVPFDRVPASAASLQRRGDIPERLKEGSYDYIASFQLGTPAQSVQALIDTGSSDLWVYGNLPSKGRSSFFPQRSSTYKLQKHGGFYIEYGKGSASGDLVTDTFRLGKATLPNYEFGVVSVDDHDDIGVWGIGLVTNEAVSPAYPNVPSLLKSHGYIARNAYSLYLNSDDAKSDGNLVFGGIDTAKYTGKLNRVKTHGDSAFAVNFEFLGVQQQGILDSGTTSLIVSNNTYFPALKAIKGWVPDLTGNVEDGFYIPSLDSVPKDKSFTLTINGVNYNIPLQQLFDQTENNRADQTRWYLGLEPGGLADKNEQLLGDSFLHTVYVYYDLEAGYVGIAPAKYTSESHVVAVPASGLPDSYFFN